MRPGSPSFRVKGTLKKPTKADPITTEHRSPAALPGAYVASILPPRRPPRGLLAVPSTCNTSRHPRGQPQARRILEEVGPPRQRSGRSTGASPRPGRPPGYGGPRQPSHRADHAEDTAPGPSTERAILPPVPAPRSTPTAPPAPTVASDSEMDELERLLINDAEMPDVPEPPGPQA